MAATKNTEYTLEQVAEANTPEKAWVILHGKVYNVSRYLDDHPGGRDVLMEVAGTDASSDFDFVGHSKSAIKSLAEFEVGSLGGYSATPKRQAKQLIQQPGAPLSSSPLLKEAVERLLKKDLPTRVYIGVCVLLPPALYYAAGKDGPLFGDWSGIAVSGQFSLVLVITLAVIAGMLAVIGRRFWNDIFHYKDVFAYPPYYTLQ